MNPDIWLKGWASYENNKLELVLLHIEINLIFILTLDWHVAEKGCSTKAGKCGTL